MLDHLIIHASDPAGMAAYYERVLGTLGYHKGVEYPGGTDNGAPGPRDYHPGYYACFVLDPEGNNIEAVLHNYKG